MDFVGDGLDQREEESRGRDAIGILDKLRESELRRSVYGDVEVKLSFRRLHLGDVDMEEADRIGLELLLCGFVAFNVRQPADPVSLQAAMQRRTRQMRDGRLQGVKAIVERQQRMLSEGDDDRLVLERQHRRMRVFRPGALIANRGPLLPLGDRLLIDAISLSEGSQALLTTLYRSTHRLCRAGAPVQNLAHSASFHSMEKIAPSNPGIKTPSQARRLPPCDCVAFSKLSIALLR